eukprot:Skav219775  [mRNA]  locus=scaffold1954:198009:198493:+ [translate_table: standard]
MLELSPAVAMCGHARCRSIDKGCQVGVAMPRGSARQIQDLHALGEWAYIATDACIFKTLDEDGIGRP